MIFKKPFRDNEIVGLQIPRLFKVICFEGNGSLCARMILFEIEFTSTGSDKIFHVFQENKRRSIMQVCIIII